MDKQTLILVNERIVRSMTKELLQFSAEIGVNVKDQTLIDLSSQLISEFKFTELRDGLELLRKSYEDSGEYPKSMPSFKTINTFIKNILLEQRKLSEESEKSKKEKEEKRQKEIRQAALRRALKKFGFEETKSFYLEWLTVIDSPFSPNPSNEEELGKSPAILEAMRYLIEAKGSMKEAILIAKYKFPNTQAKEA